MIKAIKEVGLFSVSVAIVTVFLFTLTSQTEKPKPANVKKSESSCDNYAEFKKKQKALKEKQATETSKPDKQ